MNKGSSQDDVIIHAYRQREVDYYRPLFSCINRFDLCRIVRGMYRCIVKRRLISYTYLGCECLLTMLNIVNIKNGY